VRRDEEKEQENDNGHEPDEQPCAPYTRRTTIEFGMEFFGAHGSASAFDADNRQGSL
jgi:hypothetical protein